MIYSHKWRSAEVRRNFGVLTLSFQMSRRNYGRRYTTSHKSAPLPSREGLPEKLPARLLGTKGDGEGGVIDSSVLPLFTLPLRVKSTESTNYPMLHFLTLIRPTPD